MKSKIFLAIAALYAASCNPMVDDVELKNSFDRDNIKLSVHQETPGSNEFTLKLDSKGVTGYWDYIINKAYSDEVTVIFPYTGTHTLTFHSTTPYINGGNIADREYVSESIEVEVSQLDVALNEAYYNLVGEDLGGKTWVFDGESKDGGVWWAMVNATNPAEVWWNAGGGDGVVPSDVDGKMYFDVDGGANYDYYASPDAEPVRGSFVFNGAFSTLSFPGDANLMGTNNNAAGPSTTFEIVEFTADRLVLFTPTTNGGTGWSWAFRPE